jgi:hypothetical protein
MVGMMSVLCGSLLAGTGFMKHNRPQGATNLEAAKPSVEEDAYDVVSARG